MKRIWLVLGGYAYEGTTPLRAFDTKAAAEALKARLEKHAAAQPRCPDLQAPDAEWESYRRKQTAWERRSPVKGTAYHEFYVVSIMMGVDHVQVESDRSSS